MNGYDIDGVIIGGGIKPNAEDVIITGRSYEEAPETLYELKQRGIFNAVYFNPTSFQRKTLEGAAKWKAKMINELQITDFWEDDPRQISIIERETNCLIHHVAN